jgi:hypothetical protein
MKFSLRYVSSLIGNIKGLSMSRSCVKGKMVRKSRSLHHVVVETGAS